MLRKFIVVVIFVSLFATQAAFYPSQTKAAGASEMLDLAAILPASDVVMTMDFDRAINVAGPGLLNQDATKLAHLLNLMRTIENEIGINPLEIKQVAVGFKIPPSSSKEFFADSDFTVVVRTASSNNALVENWTKRIDQILKFKQEQAPSKRYVHQFRTFRDFKPGKATPEKIAELTAKVQAAAGKTQTILATLNRLPKPATDAIAAANLREKNKILADSLNRMLVILKADTEMKTLRETSIKLINRWNTVMLDDPQHGAKLAAILKESKDIYPAYRTKYENAVKARRIVNSLEEISYDDEKDDDKVKQTFIVKTTAALDNALASLGKLPVRKPARTTALNSLTAELEKFDKQLNETLEYAAADYETTIDLTKQESMTMPPLESNFLADFNRAKREETVNGKRMLVVDTDKFDDLPVFDKTADDEMPSNSNISDATANMSISNIPRPGSPNSNVNSNANVNSKTTASADTNMTSKTMSNSTVVFDLPKKVLPDVAIGFLDDTTMVIGVEKIVGSVLKRDPSYKNPQAAEMLGSMQNSLFAFAMNSQLFSRMAADLPKATASPSPSPSSSPSATANSSADVFSKLAKDINIYGSINYDPAAQTNDVTMSLGFFRTSVEEIIPPDKIAADSADGGDSTFEIAGYQVGKDIFYDLLNSFKAVQGSLTFKFEKKKVAGLIRATPRIIEKIVQPDDPQDAVAEKSNAKPNRIKSVPDLFTTPQLYVDLAKLFQ